MRVIVSESAKRSTLDPPTTQRPGVDGTRLSKIHARMAAVTRMATRQDNRACRGFFRNSFQNSTTLGRSDRIPNRSQMVMVNISLAGLGECL